MIVSLAFAICIAILMVITWACFGDWSQTRVRQHEDTYWTTSQLVCPNCTTPYRSTDVATRWTAFSEAPCNGASIRCHECFEIADFDGTTNTPQFLCFVSQPRLCLECGERYNGLLGGSCVTCGSDKSKIPHDVTLSTTPNVPTNNAIHRSRGSAVS